MSASPLAWPRPVPLDSYTLPPFPVEIFPDWLRYFVTDLAEDTQTPIDLPGMLALAVLATCAAKRALVSIRRGWSEPLSLWVMIALGSGSRKTPVLNRMLAPVVKYDREWLSFSAPDLANRRSQRRTLEARLQTLERELAKSAVADSDQEAERVRIAEELERTPVPTAPRLLVEDITAESLASRLAEQGGRIALFSDEGGPLDILAGRYARNRIPNLDVFLKADSGSDIRVDRRGRAAEYVSAPALTMGLAVQPEIIRALGEQPGFGGRGLLSRPLYSLPLDTVGRRKTQTIPVSVERERVYEREVLRLLAGSEYVQREDFEPRVLTFPKSACRVLHDDLIEKLEPRLAPHGDLGALQGWGGKLAGKIARVAGLLHLAEYGSLEAPEEIGPFTVGKAVRLAPYLIEQAKAAFGEMGADPVRRDAKVVLEWIRSNGLERFSQRDAFNGLRSRFDRVAKLEPVLRLLEDADWIREEAQEPREGAGRPRSPAFLVNPHSQAQNPQNSVAGHGR